MENYKSNCCISKYNLNQQKGWDDFSSLYYKKVSKNTSSLMSVMCNLARLDNKAFILEGGCGPGITTKLLSFYANKSAIIYAFDFSSEMLNLCKKEFNEYTNFNSNINNSWQIIQNNNNNIIDINNSTNEIRKNKSNQIVNFLQADVENLPFKDSQFDCYISSLCIMICENYNNAIKEAYRVTKENSISLFSIWGRKELSNHFFVHYTNTLKKYLPEFIEESRSNFYLAEDLNKLKQDLINIGYKRVIFEYTNFLLDVYDVNDYINSFKPRSMNNVLVKLHNHLNEKYNNNQEKCEKEYNDILEKINDSVKTDVQNLMVDKDEIPKLDCVIIIAFK